MKTGPQNQNLFKIYIREISYKSPAALGKLYIKWMPSRQKNVKIAL